MVAHSAGVTSEQNSKRLGEIEDNDYRLELVKKADGIFDIFVNGTLHRGEIEERWLPEEICVRFGFCGSEYDAILLEAKESGGSKITY